jgi:superfamily II DNA or RNA helicase
MFDGTVKLVEDVQVGDLLMGPDSKPRRVVSITTGQEQLYRVTPVKGDPYVVNESHIISLRNNNGRVINVSVRQLWYGDSVHFDKRDNYIISNGHSGFHGWRVPGILTGCCEPDLVGIRVESIGHGDYYGFEISGPDRLFLLGDFTVTHNTVIFSYIARNAADKGNTVLILAHRDQLIKQASKKLRDYGVKHGIIMAGFTPDPTAKVQVASVQTIVRRLDKMRFKPKIIIIDEAHLSAAESYRKVIAAFPDALLLGVTGSPIRLDGKSLGKKTGGLYDLMIQGISIRKLIGRGFLVKPVVYAPAEQLDLSNIKTSMGDYKTDELATLMDKPKLTGCAVEHYKKICYGAPAITWCVNLNHAHHVCDEFNANGIKSVVLCGEDDGDVRDRALKQLERGEIMNIVFVGILVEGVDCPAIAAIIILRPTLSLSSYLQVIGRGLRPVYPDGLPLDTDEQRLMAIANSNKKCCYVLDHAGLAFKHGLADEERDWELDTEPKKKGKKKPQEPRLGLIQCVGVGGCYGIFEPAPVCPHCGKEVEVKTRSLEAAEGELAEITEDMAERLKRERQREVKGAKTLEELERIGAQRGYSKSWARHAFEAKKRTREKYFRDRYGPPV